MLGVKWTMSFASGICDTFQINLSWRVLLYCTPRKSWPKPIKLKEFRSPTLKMALHVSVWGRHVIFFRLHCFFWSAVLSWKTSPRSGKYWTDSRVCLAFEMPPQISTVRIPWLKPWWICACLCLYLKMRCFSLCFKMIFGVKLCLLICRPSTKHFLMTIGHDSVHITWLLVTYEG